MGRGKNKVPNRCSGFIRENETKFIKICMQSNILGEEGW
jgi:hypothetical protein